MQKVFRLLRHNTETGPFTIGELLQQQIGPDDLIWVDGESTAWAYPQEMDNLKYALSPNDLVKKELPKKEEVLPVAEPPKPVREIQSAIHLSPAAEIERKAEELRQRTLSFKKQPGYEPAAWAQHEYAPILPLAENDVTISYHKTKGLPVGEVLMGAMVVALLTLGWYGGGKDLFKQPKEVASAVAVKLTATEENAAIGDPETTHTDSVAVAVNHTDSATTSNPVAENYVAQATPKKPVSLASSEVEIATPKEEPTVAQQTPIVTEKKEEPKLTKQPVVAPENKETAKTEVGAGNKNEEQPTVEPEEKKKGFHLFKGLFKKKKKGDDKAEEDSTPEGQ